MSGEATLHSIVLPFKLINPNKEGYHVEASLEMLCVWLLGYEQGHEVQLKMLIQKIVQQND